MLDVAMPMDNLDFRKKVAAERSMLGAASEMLAAAAFFEAGGRVSKPLVDGNKGYDLILDDGHFLFRVQVKTISPSNQVALGWNVRRLEWATGAVRSHAVPQYRAGSFDLLAAVDRKTHEVFVIPSHDIDFTKTSVGFSEEFRAKYRFMSGKNR